MKHQALLTRESQAQDLTVHTLAVEDPFADTELRWYIDAQVAELTTMANEWFATRGGPVRSPRVCWENPATDRLFAPDTHPALRHWRSTQVPSAAALLLLHRPDLRRLADGTPLNESELRWSCNLLDAIGARSRVEITRQLLREHATRVDGGPQRWLSLGCGGSVPVFAAAQEVGAEAPVRLTLADYDRAALEFAERLAGEYGLRDSVDLRRVSILPAYKIAKWFEPGHFDCVEMIGLFEYLQTETWQLEPGESEPDDERPQLMTGAVTLLRSAYALVRPGGMLVFSNMLPTHPQLDFTLHVIQWPHIQPRTPDEVASIALAAGIPQDQLRAYVATDGVYGVFTAHKPIGG